MNVSLESKSLPSVGNSRKSYLQVTSQRLARGKLVHFHGRRSLALPSVGPACGVRLPTCHNYREALGGIPQHYAKWLRNHFAAKGFLFTSPPCIPDLLMAKDFKALVLHVFELSIALPWIPNNSPQSHIALVLRIPTSFNLLLGQPWIHRAGAIPSSLHQKVKFIHDGQAIMTLEIEEFCRDFVAIRQQRPSEFIATIDHDTIFGLGFIPTEVDYHYMAWLRKEMIRPCLEEIDSVVHTNRKTELQHIFHQLQLSDGAPNTSFPMVITPISLDRVSLLSLCFPEEIIDDGVIVDPIEMIDGVVPHNKYRDEIDMMTTILVPKLLEDDSSLFRDTVSPVEGESDLVDPPLSFDVLSRFVFRSDDVSIASFMDLNDEIAQPDSDKDYFGHNSDPIDERVSPATGDVETIDFDTEDQPRELEIGSPLSTDERYRLIHLLRSYLDVFAWSYEDMHGLDPSIVQHHLPILPHARPLKQKLRRLHPQWLANVVPVPKKDSKVRVCVDFRDLNKASPKDDFPLSHIDLLVDNTAGHSMLSFMDGFLGYNKILMALEVMEKTTFITEADHLESLERFFERIQKFILRLNPKKYTFGMTSGKLLGHMVSERGIKVDPDKIKVIRDMPASKTEKEIRGF
ncbi:hypothetical protein CK203_065011 [Vitis vinifera]|uniref:Transposon Ty3-I Gag-Pol polyprotein n=1 Tax=Vitis vinifera TaxID=29760 RepID=A0A438G6E4_VITVI|nr:hypothetical protein CK203_065011 [Vitis vinifera]